MKGRTGIAALFVIAALYDGLLGLVFLFLPGAVFRWFAVTPPNHFGYVQFPAALLIVFALMFLSVSRNPDGNRNLIPYGMLLKVSYCSVVFAYWFTRDLPDLWKPFAVADFIFLVLFGWAYVSLGRSSAREGAAPRAAGGVAARSSGS